MAIKIIKDVFTQQEIYTLYKEISNPVNESKWSINKHFWEDGIQNKSLGVVSILRLEGPVRAMIENNLKQYLEPGEQFQYIQYYEWNQMSQINWHSDSGKKAAITVYLNEEWHPNWGGFFCWQDPSADGHLIVPKFNTGVVVRGNPPHHVSLISPLAPIRKTLQIWIVDSVQLTTIEE